MENVKEIKSGWQQFLDHNAFMFVIGDGATHSFGNAYSALEHGEPVVLILFNREMPKPPASQEEFNSAFVASFDLVFGGECEKASNLLECDKESRKMFRVPNDGNYEYFIGLPEPEIVD